MKAYHLSSYDDVASPNFQTTPYFHITSASISFIQHNYVFYNYNMKTLLKPQKIKQFDMP